MNKLQLDTQTDETGSIQVRLPGRQAAYRVRVTVEWDDAAAPNPGGWPEGWLQSTAGSIDDPTFVRQPQGEPEARGELE